MHLMNFIERHKQHAVIILAASWLAGCASLGSSPQDLTRICDVSAAGHSVSERIDSFRRKLSPTNIDGAVVLLDNRPVMFLLLGSRDEAGVEHWFGTDGARMSIGSNMLLHLEGFPVDDFSAAIEHRNGVSKDVTPVEGEVREVWTWPLQGSKEIVLEPVELDATMTSKSCCPTETCVATAQQLSIGSRRLPQQRVVITDTTLGVIRAAVFPLADGYQSLRFVRLSDKP